VNIKQAKSIAFGSKPATDLQQYYSAWQWLYDNDVELTQADADFLDKLICDGQITIDK